METFYNNDFHFEIVQIHAYSCDFVDLFVTYFHNFINKSIGYISVRDSVRTFAWWKTNNDNKRRHRNSLQHISSWNANRSVYIYLARKEMNV